MKNTIIFQMIVLAMVYTIGNFDIKKGPSDIYGKWNIDKAVLKSEMYTGTTLDGDYEENLYDPEDYIGLELEYSEYRLNL